MIWTLTKEEADEFTIEEKKGLLASFCCDFIEDNGYIRMGFAIKEIFPEGYWNESDNLSVRKSVSALLVHSGQYIREPIKYGDLVKDFDVLPNPNIQFNEDVHKTNKSVRRTNIIQIITLILTIGISIFTSAIAWLTYKKNNAPVVNVAQPIQKTDTLRLGTTRQDTFLLYSH